MKHSTPSSVSVWRAALGAIALAATGLTSTAHAADAYPSKPITLVIPFSPGGSTDILGRLLAQKLSEGMNTNVIVENKPGANGTIGVDRVAKAAPDGYTIVLADVGGMAISTSLYPKLPYQPLRDLAPVSLVGRSPLVLTVGNNSPLQSLADLNAAAKANPATLNYPSSGTGGPNHMGGELYAMQAGVKVTHVPYKGSAPSVVSLVSGETDFGFLTAVTINAQLKAGNLRALAVAHDTRLPAMPEVPTMDEAGLKGFMADAWFMAAVPAGTPQPIIDRLQREIAKVLPQEDVKTKLEAVGVLPAGLSPQASSEFLTNEIGKWREVVKTAKITLD